MLNLGRNVQVLHGWKEKEVVKMIERMSKDRSKTSKADDEEVSMKVIDTANATRIACFLREAVPYLDPLV